MAEIVRQHRLRYAGGPSGATTPFENLIWRDSALSPALGSSLWETCPWLALQQDPSLGPTHETRFMGSTAATNAVGGFTTTTATSGAVTIDATKGLKLDAGAVTAAQGVNFQMTQTPFAVAAGKPVWFEGLVRFESLTSLKIQFLFGLAVVQTALIATSAVGTDDKIAFDGVTTAGTILSDCTASTTSGTGTGFTIVNSTNFKLGFYATTTNVDFWVNGAIVKSLTANIPTTALAPSIVCMANATVQPLVYLKWLRVAGIY